MGFFDDWFSWAGARFVARNDGRALQLPGPVMVPNERRVVVPRRDSIMNDFTGLGGSGDKGSVGRPNTFFSSLNERELLALYTNNGISRTIIDEIPKRATRKGWDVEGLDLGEDKSFQTALQIREGSQMGRLYGGAAGVIVTEDDIPPGFERQPWKWLQQPLDLERVGRVIGLIIFDTFEAQPFELERSPMAGADYRRPKLWTIGAEGFEQLHSLIHASRVLQFRGRTRTPSEQWSRNFWSGQGRGGYWQQDDSTLQAVWEEVRRLTETMQGGAVLAQELSTSVFHIDGMAAAKAYIEAMRKKFVVQTTEANL